MVKLLGSTGVEIFCQEVVELSGVALRVCEGWWICCLSRQDPLSEPGLWHLGG
jgi:hypothetical protein